MGEEKDAVRSGAAHPALRFIRSGAAQEWLAGLIRGTGLVLALVNTLRALGGAAVYLSDWAMLRGVSTTDGADVVWSRALSACWHAFGMNAVIAAVVIVAVCRAGRVAAFIFPAVRSCAACAYPLQDGAGRCSECGYDGGAQERPTSARGPASH